MVRVEIVNSLSREIKKKFKGESHEIIDLLESLKENPSKGKFLGNVAGIVIKELRYKSFRFYFIADGFKLKCFGEDELIDVLIRFVRMSNKRSQQKVIGEIREVLQKIGAGGFC